MTKTKTPDPSIARSTDTFALVHPGLIVPDPANVRADVGDVGDIAASIFQVGLQQPLRVRFVPQGFLENDPTCAVYVVIAGHRRLAAIRLLIEQGLWEGDVPCMLAPEETSADDITAAMLVENLQRSDLNPVEEGRAFERLTREFRYKRPDLAVKIGRSESYVADRLAVVKLPQSIQDSITAGHYPLTHALLLKGVAAEIVEKITKGGRTVVTDSYAIQRAVAEAEYQKLKAALTAAAQASGIEFVTEDRFGFRNSSDEIAVFSTLDDAKLLAKYEGAPKAARLVVDDSPYSNRFAIELRKPLTERQIEQRREKAQQAWTAEQEQRERDRQHSEQQIRASWTPEYRAWIDECDRLKAEHVAAVTEHEAALDAAYVDWSQRVDVKLVARWSMLNVLRCANNDTLISVAKMLGIDTTWLEAEEDLQTYVLGDAKKLVSVVAMLLDGDNFPQATEAASNYVGITSIPDVPELVLPPEPGTDATTPTEEDPNDEPVDDAA